MSSLEIRGLNLIKKDDDRGRIKLIDSLNLTLKDGEVHVIYGEFGSGKSVIANLLGGYLKPSWELKANTIRANGVDLIDANGFNFKNLIRAQVGVILQRPQDIIDSQVKIGMLFKKAITIKYNGPWYKYFGWKERHISRLMHRLGIKEPRLLMESYLNDLSSAEKHITMAVFGLLNKPKLIIVDEPNNALSHSTTEKILNYLYNINQNSGTTILFLTSDYDMVHDYVDRASFLYNGQLLETINQTSDIIDRVHNPYSYHFLKTRTDFAQPIPFQSKLACSEISLTNLEFNNQGCRYGNICKFSQAKCSKIPPLTKYGQHEFYCHYPINLMSIIHKNKIHE